MHANRCMLRFPLLQLRMSQACRKLHPWLTFDFLMSRKLRVCYASRHPICCSVPVSAVQIACEQFPQLLVPQASHHAWWTAD